MKFEKNNKNSIKELFNSIAGNYDRLNDYMSFGLQRIIKNSAVIAVLKKTGKTPKSVLDLCTGTGDIALLFKKYSNDSQIVAVDFSSEMLSIARKRDKNIIFAAGDITNPDSIKQIEDKKFDVCFIGFGLRNLPDIDDFLLNIKKYLKPGGILGILDLGKPKGIMRLYFWFHYEIFIPLLAFLFNKDTLPYKYFINSAKTYISPEDMLLKLKKYGYIEVENINYSFGVISLQLAIKDKNSLDD